jgi:hypothetical protein
MHALASFFVIAVLHTATVTCGATQIKRALLATLLLIAAASTPAQPPVKQVLMLQSLDRGNLILDHFTGNFRVSLDERAGKPVNVVQVVVGPTGAAIAAPEQAVVTYIRSLYADRPPPDLIVTTGGPAAVFARKHRRELFPETPLLFASVDQRYLRSTALGDNETSVAVANDFPRVIDDILRVLPETRQVFVVIGAGSLGRFWREQLEPEFARFRDRVTIAWSDELSQADILAASRLFRTIRRSSISPSASTRKAGPTRTSKCSPPFARRPMLRCSERSPHC